MWSLSRILSHTVLKQEAARRHQLWPMIGFTKTGEISQLWYSLLLTACQHNIVDHRRVSASYSGRAAAIVSLILLLFLSETIWKCHEPGQFFPLPLTHTPMGSRLRAGDWELWIWETFHGVVNNKVRHFDKVVIGKVVQSYSRMKSKSKYGLLPDNILYNDYISCFAVSCSRWLPTAWCWASASCWTNADKSMN